MATDARSDIWRYLLDANPVIVFQRAGHLADLIAAAGTVPMAMVDDVHAELTIPRPGKQMTPEMREAARALSGRVIPIVEIDASSLEDADVAVAGKASSNLDPPLWWGEWIATALAQKGN